MTDHAAEARKIMSAELAVPRDQVGIFAVQAAQVHATLALAEEQRTANLVAFYGLTGPEFDIEDLDYSALRVSILTRLGLTPTTPNQEQ